MNSNNSGALSNIFESKIRSLINDIQKIRKKCGFMDKKSNGQTIFSFHQLINYDNDQQYVLIRNSCSNTFASVFMYLRYQMHDYLSDSYKNSFHNYISCHLINDCIAYNGLDSFCEMIIKQNLPQLNTIDEISSNVIKSCLDAIDVNYKFPDNEYINLIGDRNSLAKIIMKIHLSVIVSKIFFIWKISQSDGLMKTHETVMNKHCNWKNRSREFLDDINLMNNLLTKYGITFDNDSSFIYIECGLLNKLLFNITLSEDNDNKININNFIEIIRNFERISDQYTDITLFD